MEIKDVVLDDADGNLATKGDQIVANGRIDFEPTVHWSVPIRQGATESLRFSIEAKETSDLRLDIRMAAASVQKEYRLGPPHLISTSVIPVGGVPVVIAWVLTFNVGIDGRVSVGVGTEVKNVHTTNTGLQCANWSCTPFVESSNNFTYIPPTVHAGLDAKGYVSARLQALVYGVAGPYAEVRGYLQLKADTMLTPWWELYAGVEVPVGLRMDMLGSKKLANYSTVALGARHLLAQAQYTTATATHPAR